MKSYDNYAEEWSKMIRNGLNISHNYLEKPAMYSKLPKDLSNLSVLCVGCGTGEECEYIKNLGAKKVVGIDKSEKFVEFARENYKDIEFHVMDMESMNFHGQTFDIVYSSLALHYVESFLPTLKKIHHVLKDKGQVIISTHHPLAWASEKYKTETESVSLLGYRKPIKKGSADLHIYGDYLNKRAIEEVWFKELKVNFFHQPLSNMLNEIRESSFLIHNVIEPKPIDSLKEIDHNFWAIHQKLPLFIVFVLVKM